MTPKIQLKVVLQQKLAVVVLTCLLRNSFSHKRMISIIHYNQQGLDGRINDHNKPPRVGENHNNYTSVRHRY